MNSKYAPLLISLILVGILLVDAVTPLGYAVWIGYVFAVLLAMWVEQQNAPYMVAAIVTVLIAAGHVLSPPGLSMDVAIFNRAIGIALMWVAAYLVERAKTAKLDDATRRLGAIVENSSDAILSVTPNGIITSWNRGAERIFGYTAAEVIGRPVQMLLPENLHHDKFWSQAAAQGIQRSPFHEGVLLAKNGQGIDVSYTLSPLKDVYGGYMGVSQIIRDVSARKQEQAFLREAREALEMKVRERTFELNNANHSLRELSSRLMQVQEEERQRLARDLHDEIGQLLTALKIDLQAFQHGKVGQSRAASLTDSLGLVDRLLNQVRTIALDLRPPLLDDLGLTPAIRWYANRQAERNRWILTLSVEQMTGRLPAPMELACFRVVQEALTNVARHSRAKVVDLTLRRQDQGITCIIQDDGVGFDAHSARQRAYVGKSMGLLSMEERVRLAGGRLMISSTPGQGCKLELHFPLAGHDTTETHGRVEAVSL